jgi:hypothetical protein
MPPKRTRKRPRFPKKRKDVLEEKKRREKMTCQCAIAIQKSHVVMQPDIPSTSKPTMVTAHARKP